MSDLLKRVKRYLAADVPVLLWGPPGVGKTAAVNSLASNEGAHLETLIGSTLDPVDVGGYLIPTSSGVLSAPPPWAERLRRAIAEGREAWLFLDELSCAPPAVQAALLRVIHERRVGECDLTGVKMLAGANPAEHAADGGWLPSATANRWAHLDWILSPQAWVSGTITGWGKGYKNAAHRAAAAEVAGWITHSPQALLRIPKAEQSGRAWPSPRSWTAAINALGIAPADADEATALVGGCVGDSAASEWATWRATLDLPDPEAVLNGTAKVPERGDRAATTLGAVAMCAMQPHQDQAKRLLAAWQVLSKCRADVALTAAAALVEQTGEVPDVARALGQRLMKVTGK